MNQIFTSALEFKYLQELWGQLVEYFQRVAGLFINFKYYYIFDILFVAVLLFFIIRIIRETRAIQLIKGILFIAIMFFVVNLLQMNASSKLLGALFNNILVIVVILFGPEIRNVLEQIGKGTARTSLRTILNSGSAIELNKVKNTIDAVCKACVEMSNDKVGALIVFENETQISNIAESGTILNSRASKELICNIFFPKASLHDGAMVIRDGEIYAAGCILPLTRDNSISSDLGTRHRAAIGISQECDGIAVVVSEETGSISYAQNGNLVRNVTSGELREELTKLLVDSRENEGGILRKLLRRNKNNG